MPVPLPWQRRPAEHVPGHGWYQGGEHLRRVKPHYAFVWPKDGKRGSKMGRWKDIFANEGPDIHVAISADKRDALYNRQRRARCYRWTELDDREPDGALAYRPPWVRFFRGQEKKYDFRTRKYGRLEWDTWTDARWQEEPNEDFYYPYALRDLDGEWWEDHPEKDMMVNLSCLIINNVHAELPRRYQKLLQDFQLVYFVSLQGSFHYCPQVWCTLRSLLA